MKDSHPIFHPLGHIIAAYLVAKGVVPEQLTLFEIEGRPNGLSVSGHINVSFACDRETGALVHVYPARRVVNVPTGGLL